LQIPSASTKIRDLGGKAQAFLAVNKSPNYNIRHAASRDAMTIRDAHDDSWLPQLPLLNLRNSRESTAASCTQLQGRQE